MPTTLPPPAANLPSPPAPNRKRWTRKDCEFLVDNGLLTGRYELIDGEVISKMGQKRPHAISVMLVTRWLMRLFGDDHVQCQLPIDVAAEDQEINEPEPDLTVTIAPVASYTVRHPGPGDVVLAVEIADSSLQFDLRTKAPLYARAGLPEYWVVDIVNRRIITHRGAEAEGYAEILEFGETEEIAALRHPESKTRVSDLLPLV